MEFVTVIGIVFGCAAIFQLGQAYELLREIRRRNDEFESKLRG